jgi:hypothetical protein
MPRPLRFADANAPANIRAAVEWLDRALDLLKLADCPQSAKAVRRAKKSAEGALRHAHHRRRKTLEAIMQGEPS